MRRLAIARHLFQAGVEQASLLPPSLFFPWHDAAEFFLQAALEHKKAILAKQDFLAYWPALKEKGVALTGYARMKRFNRARVSLKHDGTLPARVEIEDFHRIVGDFLEENSPAVFAMNFDDISLSGLVRTVSVRSALEAAENSIRIGDHKTALEEATRAFRLTLSEYRSVRLEIGLPGRLKDPVPTGLFLRFGIRFGPVERTLLDAMDRMSEAITVIAYNLDFDGYRCLQTYGPIVHELVGGKMHMDWAQEPPIDSEIVWRCIRFATDTALRLENRGSS
jgi:hypothetical protein